MAIITAEHYLSSNMFNFVSTVCSVVSSVSQVSLLLSLSQVTSAHWVPLCFSCVSRCFCQPPVTACDHLWSGTLQRLSLCIMEVVLAATEWPLPPRCPQGGSLPGRRPTASPHRGEEGDTHSFGCHKNLDFNICFSNLFNRGAVMPREHVLHTTKVTFQAQKRISETNNKKWQQQWQWLIVCNNRFPWKLTRQKAQGHTGNVRLVTKWNMI